MKLCWQGKKDPTTVPSMNAKDKFDHSNLRTNIFWEKNYLLIIHFILYLVSGQITDVKFLIYFGFFILLVMDNWSYLSSQILSS